MTEPAAHESVLLTETLELLATQPGNLVVDATLGAGGHSEPLLEAVGPAGRVFGIERDPQALALARRRLSRYADRLVPVHGNHHALRELLEQHGLSEVDRILFDLGLSSMQIDDPERGFSFRNDGPLDMRMDPDDGPSAAALLASISVEELARILWSFGEERRARSIARSIVAERERRPIERTRHLAEVVERALGPAARRYRIHPATRTFQALRIAVNDEIEGLEALIVDAVSLLSQGGRIAVISFHSLEDRAVKHAFRGLAQRCVCPPRLPKCGCGRVSLVRILTSRPVRPSTGELSRNPRARSAKLRAAERL